LHKSTPVSPGHKNYGFDEMSFLSSVEKSKAADELNEKLLKTLESDLFQMQSEVKQKDVEIERLLEELMKKKYI